MEVEKNVETPPRKMTAKTKLTILFSVLGVLIVGVVIAILIVLVNRDGGQTSDNSNANGENGSSSDINIDTNTEGLTDELSDEEVVATYEQIIQEINQKIVEAKERADETGEMMTIEEMIELYKEKIDAAKNIKVKAMLASEYYMLKMAQTPGEEIKDEILGGLIEIDGILKTAQSALRVYNVALQYGDNELADKYYVIGMERASAEVEERGVDEGSETTPEEEETAG